MHFRLGHQVRWALGYQPIREEAGLANVGGAKKSGAMIKWQPEALSSRTPPARPPPGRAFPHRRLPPPLGMLQLRQYLDQLSPEERAAVYSYAAEQVMKSRRVKADGKVMTLKQLRDKVMKMKEEFDHGVYDESIRCTHSCGC